MTVFPHHLNSRRLSGFKAMIFIFISSYIVLFVSAISSSAAVPDIPATSRRLDKLRLLKSDAQSIVLQYRSPNMVESASGGILPLQTYVAVPLQGQTQVNVTEYKYQTWNKDSGIQSRTLSGFKSDSTTQLAAAELNQLVRLDDPQFIRDLRVVRLTIKPTIDLGTVKRVFTELIIEIKANKEEMVTNSIQSSQFIPTIDTTVRSIGLEKVLHDLVINYDSSSLFRGKPALSTVSSAAYPGSMISSIPSDNKSWAMITIAQSGFYKIGYNALTQAGIDPKKIAPGTIRLFLQNQEIPIRVTGIQTEYFNEKNFIVWYNSPIDSPYTNTNVYWLTWGSETGKRIPVKDILSFALTTSINRIIDTVRLEENHLFEESVVSTIAGNDHWFWKILKSGKPVAIPVPLYGLETSMPISNTDSTYSLCTLTINFYGKSESDHHLKILLNNLLLDEIRWAGKTEKQYTRGLPATQLAVGINTIQLEVASDTSFQDNEEIYLNYVQVTYPCELKTHDGFLSFRAEQILSLVTTAKDTTGKVDILTESDARNYVVASIDTTGIPVQLRCIINQNHVFLPIAIIHPMTQYIVSSLSAMSTVELSRYDAKDIDDLRNTNQQADYIIITHPLFLPVAEKLAAYRRNLGLTVRIVNIESIYTQFSYGMFDPRAIRAFLQYAFYYWQKPAPNYVVLIGDASSDYKGNFANGVINYIPSYRQYIVSGECASDTWYTEICGTDNIPDMLVGRISVNNITDAETILDKIIRYEQQPEFGLWRDTILFMADDGFEENCEKIKQDFIPDTYISKEIDLRGYGLEDNFFLPTSVKSKISMECNQVLLDALSQGDLMTIYFGHGSPNVWAHERILFGGDSKNSDMKRLTNGDKLTFVVNLTCSTGGFDYPQKPWNICISEDMHRTKTGGAIALYCPSGLGFTPQHQILTEYLCTAMFKDNQRILGDAIGQAVIEYAFEKRNDLMPDMFILFGDPAMELAIPRSTFTLQATPDVLPTNQDNPVILSSKLPIPLDGEGLLSFNNDTNRPVVPVKVQRGILKDTLTIPSSDTAEIIPIHGYIADTVKKLDAIGAVQISVDSIKLALGIEPGVARKGADKTPVAIVLSNRSKFAIGKMTVYITIDNDTTVFKRTISLLRENATQKFMVSLTPGLHEINVRVSIGTKNYAMRQIAVVNEPAGIPAKLAILPKDILFQPNPPIAGENEVVSVPIHNLGSISTSTEKVSFWNGPTQIDKEITVPPIPAFSSCTATFNWNTRGKTGKQEVLVKRNRETFIKTTTELVKQADVAISTTDIGFSKPFYTDGQTVFMIVTVRNLGDVPSKQVEITGFDGDPRRGGRLLENMGSWETIFIPEIPAHGYKVIQVRWDAYNNAGDHQLYVAADRNNRIPDSNRENNTAFRKIHIRTKPNLDIISKDKDIIKSPDFDTSRKVILVATVKNTGETDADNVIIQFYDGEDKETRVAIGEEVLLPILRSGESYTARVDWIAPKEKERRKHNINVEVGTKQSVWKTFESLPPSR